MQLGGGAEEVGDLLVERTLGAGRTAYMPNDLVLDKPLLLKPTQDSNRRTRTASAGASW